MTPERFRILRTPEGGVSIGYSAIAQYRACPRKFWWSYLQGGDGVQLADVGPPDFKLLYGKLWHALYHGRLLGRTDPESLRGAMAEDGLSLEQNMSIIEEIIDDMDWYEHQPKDMKVRILSCEEELQVRVGRHIVRGTPDLIAQVEADWGGGTYVIDHKTWVALSTDGKVYTKPHDSAIARHFHSRQFPFYMALWNELHPDQACRQAIVNLVPQRIRAIGGRLAERTRGNKVPPTLTREFVFCQPDFIATVLHEAHLACNEIAERLNAGAQAFAGNNSECVKQFGLCPFLPLCESGNDTLESKLANLYEARTFANTSEVL